MLKKRSSTVRIVAELEALIKECQKQNKTKTLTEAQRILAREFWNAKKK